MHIAETREQAYADVAHGIEDWFDYFQHTAAFPQMDVGTGHERQGVHRLRQRERHRLRSARPTTPLSRSIGCWKQSNGGFGAFLQLAHDWADPPAKWRSFDLFARHVAPRFQGQHSSTRDAKARARRRSSGAGREQPEGGRDGHGQVRGGAYEGLTGEA